MKRLIAAIFGILFLCPTAHAITHSYIFSGTITELDPFPMDPYLPDDLKDIFSIGTPFTGTLEYEYSNPPPHFPALDEDPTVGHYCPPYQGFRASYSILIDESLAVNSNNADDFIIYNGVTDRLELLDTEGITGTYADYQFWGDAILDFYDDTGTVFYSNLLEDLPILDRSSFNRTRVSIGFYDTDFIDQMALRGEIDDIYPTPEPATMVLFGVGMVGLGVIKRKIRRTTG